MTTDQGYQHRLSELDARIGRARPDPAVVCERAAGLLAGRIGCRVDEAHTHLRQLSAEQGRHVHEIAADVLAALEARGVTPPGRLRTAADALTRQRRPSPAPPRPQQDGLPPAPAWADIVQQVLDALPGRRILVAPMHDPDGLVVDYRFMAVSPSVVDLAGRRREQLLGRTVSEVYPSIVDGPVWAAWRESLADGMPREVGPVPYVSSDGDSPAGVTVTVQVQPLGPGLLNSWVRHDEQTRLAERMAHTERLGNLGWGEWDLVTDTTVWSDELYRIYERDPADGPMTREETDALVLADDEPVRKQATVAFGRGETADLLYRIRVNGKIKHLRAVVDAVRDAHGRPLKIYGILQDVTARESSRTKLADVERQLREHQESLAIEHRLAAQLQQIVLPIPDAPIDLPGARVAVRYLPAERASRVGGDWYHAAAARDGSVILAVGDVAGHGVQAAATMAQLRHTLTALTVTTTTEPADLLSNLNELLYAGDAAAGTATAVIMRLDPATRLLRWAQAGHPPPLHTRAGVTTELPRPHGPLLGAVSRPGYDTAGITLEHDDVVVLYTDGLVEHRSHSLAEGLVPVVARLNRFSAERRPPSLAGLLAELHTANPDDDTCILAARCIERRHD